MKKKKPTQHDPEPGLVNVLWVNAHNTATHTLPRNAASSARTHTANPQFPSSHAHHRRSFRLHDADPLQHAAEMRAGNTFSSWEAQDLQHLGLVNLADIHPTTHAIQVLAIHYPHVWSAWYMLYKKNELYTIHLYALYTAEKMYHQALASEAGKTKCTGARTRGAAAIRHAREGENWRYRGDRASSQPRS